MTATDLNCSWHTDPVFTVARLTPDAIEKQVAAASYLPVGEHGFLSLTHIVDIGRLAHGFAHDHSRTCLGQGHSAFAAARVAFEKWIMFDLGWVRVANPRASIEPGQIVAVEVRSIGLWSLNLSRIVDVVDTGVSFGFIYSTTPLHVERGEERFLLEFDPVSGEVWYELEAVSRPRNPLARLGFPVARAFQHKFARDSHFRMREAVPGTVT